MLNKKAVTCVLLFGSCLAAALAWGLSEEGIAKEKPKAQPKKQAANERIYFESAACYTCHNQEPTFNDQILKPRICKCNEFDIWESKDKHRLAYLALTGERAKTMAKNLKYDVTTHKACVACHSIWIEDKQVREENKAMIEEGVGCIVCHTDLRNNEVDWVDMHASAIKKKRQIWRESDRAVKQKKYGMRDLWDPIERTKLCVSCHVGNKSEGKELTHDMYAAGHPPLPSFDMSNFSDAMRHWEYVARKPAEVKSLFKFDEDKAKREQIDLVNIGGLVTFRESMILLGAQAGDNKAWPELAQFDCYSCHHDLKFESWRLKRVKKGRPGRPGVPEWSTSLVELALFHGANGDPVAAQASIKEFRAKLGELRSAFDKQPFGSPGDIVATTKALVDFVNEKTDKLKQGPVADTKLHRQLLDQLVKNQKEMHLDQDAARQVAGAFRAIYYDGWTKEVRDPEIIKSLNALDDQLSYTFDSKTRAMKNQERIAITSALAEVRKRDRDEVAPFLRSKLAPLQLIYADEMNIHLAKINEYRPEDFQKKMNSLGARLQKK